MTAQRSQRKKMLSDAKEKIETEQKAVVKIVGVTEKETLYKVKKKNLWRLRR